MPPIAKGYVAALIATDDDGGTVAVTNNTFTMPAKDVTVVSFAPDPEHFSDDGNNAYTIKTATGWNVFCDRLDARSAGFAIRLQ
mgnify:CR=1 FL=1